MASIRDLDNLFDFLVTTIDKIRFSVDLKLWRYVVHANTLTKPLIMIIKIHRINQNLLGPFAESTIGIVQISDEIFFNDLSVAIKGQTAELFSRNGMVGPISFALLIILRQARINHSLAYN